MKKFLMAVLFLNVLASVSLAGVVGREVEYKAGDVTLKGYLAYDEVSQDKRPGVLIVHEWWGHNAYVRERAEMLAQEGYIALAVDMYGDGKTAKHPDDAKKFSSEAMSNREAMQARFTAGLELLEVQELTDPQKIAAIGYCFGGTTVLTMAREGIDLNGVVSFHGGLGSSGKPQAGKVKPKILVCHGGADEFITPEQIAAFKEEMDGAGAEYQFNIYEGAKHSFTNPQADEFAKEFGMPIAYNAEADRKSWADMLEFFKEIF